MPQGLVPTGVAAFVGRERERAQVGELLAESRVVTLTGSGGCGKTRLAAEVAGGLASTFGDGAGWVELQAVSDPDMVAAAVAEAVKVRERSGPGLVDTLAEQLAERELLLVLDNCEHLIAACAELVSRLTSACPQLHVLATSREPLAVEGESTFGVGPLPVPPTDAASATAVTATDAARLFELRARQVRTQFRINNGNAGAVAEICRRLDGIPLAIELAAARVRMLAPDQIVDGLSDRFGLLTGGPRSAPTRQQTLEASLQWSWSLLNDAERLALARLSVFAGAFQLDAAEGVVGGDGADRGQVLGVISGLVEQSLLQVTESDGRARYRLLETIRAYARQRLTELEDPDEVRDRHLSFYVELARQAQAGLDGEQPEEWVPRLTADLDDLRAAMERAVATENLAALLGLTEPILRFWVGRGLSNEIHLRLNAAAQAPGTPAHERARALGTATALAIDRGQYADAHRSAGRAIEAAREAGAEDVLAMALGSRVQAGTMSGCSSTRQVEADYQEAVRLLESCEDPATRAYVMATAGNGPIHVLSIDDGCRRLGQLLQLCEEQELVYQLAFVHAAIGYSPVFSGRLDWTRRHAKRAVELCSQLGRPGWEACGLVGLGAAAVLQGDSAAATGHLSRAQEILQEHSPGGSQQHDSVLRPWQAFAAYASGDLDLARTSAERLRDLGRAADNRWVEAMGELLLGSVAHLDGSADEARECWQRCRELATDPRFPSQLGRSLLGLAELAAEDDFDEAWELAHDGLETLSEYGDRVGAAEALEVIADLVVASDEHDRSLRLLGASERFHSEAGIARFPLGAGRFERARDAARNRSGEAEATACWEAGGELSLEEAVAYARRGRGERQRPMVGWASLTPAERDVVRLVAEGHTNARIGELLFMSVNTVKSHLKQVYRKLDVDGRADLAAEVTRRGV
jgi:predicted ATPase/DNA-binding CsgD family transcriptional regulator